MNLTPPLPPSDDELEALLSARVRRTSPEFEQRWRALRLTFAAPTSVRRSRWGGWLLWPGLATAAVAAAVLALAMRHAPGPLAYRDAAFERLIALDAALRPAEPLLNAEYREAVLHLPVGTAAAGRPRLLSR